jgi:indolepyruvate ferredoxin oxidoreductase
MATIDAQFDLRDLHTRESGRTFMTGVQALVRLPLMQRRLDRRAGLNTAGLVSGYRGSPLGAYDQQLSRVGKLLEAHDIVFQPGLNEDLAATALWGAQMHAAFGRTRADGVFGIWYGKGPGVDRAGDVFRNANILGASALGGVLAVAGDDHAAQSSMFPHQTDGIFQSVSIPILQPATVSEILSLGLTGFALSRFSGLWVGMKTIAEVVESAAAFELPDPYPQFQRPVDFAVPAHGLNWDSRVAWPAQRVELERRLIEERLPAALAWARANRLDRLVVGGRGGLGVVTVGKAHQDLMQAFANIGLDDADLRRLGVGVYKVAMSWPLEPTGLQSFAEGRPELLVVEEKRDLVEAQIRNSLYHLPADARPRVVGKRDDHNAPLLPETFELDPLMVVRAVIRRLTACGAGDGLAERLQTLEARVGARAPTNFPVRKPYFCSGCPHNTSTRVPDGSIAGGGIGCHVMALSMPERRTSTFSQMGGEGAQWIGAAPFSETGHIFQNLGDGTYQHSGLLAVRAAVAASTNITFKILYNDAVAMTGGQKTDGVIDPARVTRQLLAEGVARVALVSEGPEAWRNSPLLPAGVEVHPRDNLDAVQQDLRNAPGVTAIVYEQTCAAEKRRRRKKAELPQTPRRLFINERVCEGCGDCSIQSNCIAVEPLETEFGRKRKINQNSCNADLSCVKGFCPSFVEIDGARLRKPDANRLEIIQAERLLTLPAPAALTVDGDYNIVVAGVGGAGVLTIGALLGVAAYFDGKASTVLDFTGLAQKNGAVFSQIRLAAQPTDIPAARIGPADADLLLAGDLVAATHVETLSRLSAARTHAVVNIEDAPTADVVRQRDMALPMSQMLASVQGRSLEGRTRALRASRIAQGLFGDAVAANVLLLGFAWQSGLLPLSEAALLRALEVNGAAVEVNKRAFVWGRLAAVDLEDVERVAGLEPARPVALSLDEIVEKRAQDLREYQNLAYAARFRELVDAARRAGVRAGDHDERFATAVADSAYRLMAYKDEYEVARLYSRAEFKAALSSQFQNVDRVSVWLAPPILSRPDPTTGRPKKRKFGPWIFGVFAVLARLKILRGTIFDPFGRTEERRTERRLAEIYASLIAGLSSEMTSERLEGAIALARAPQEIRGFGPVKAFAIKQAVAQIDHLRAALEQASDRALDRVA